MLLFTMPLCAVLQVGTGEQHHDSNAFICLTAFHFFWVGSLTIFVHLNLAATACKQFRTPVGDWLFNTSQRNQGSELTDAGRGAAASARVVAHKTRPYEVQAALLRGA